MGSEMCIRDRVYPDVKLQKCKDAAEVESLVKSEDAELGYVVYSTSEYTYYVYNKGMLMITPVPLTVICPCCPRNSTVKHMIWILMNL